MKSYLQKISIAILILFLSSYSSFVYGQDYIILPSGERISGTIKRTFDNSHYTSIEFTSSSGQQSKLTPEDINGFILENGRQFRSLIEPNSSEQIFLQLLVQGPLSLLSHEKLFYIDNGEELIQLRKADKKVLAEQRMTTVAQGKPYIAILNMLMSGSCGFQLREQIASTTYHEQAFIDLVKAYHECENNPHELIVAHIPAKKLKPYVMGGMQFINPIVLNQPDGRNDAIEISPSAVFILGLKGYQFRHRTRMGFDVGIGVSKQDVTVHSILDGKRNYITATERHNTTTVLLPLFINYSLTKSPASETYVGIGGVIGNNFQRVELAIMDVRPTYSSSIQLVERQFINRRKLLTTPSLKLGTHIKHSEKIGFLIEIQAAYNYRNYYIDLEETPSTFSELHSAILFGIRF